MYNVMKGIEQMINEENVKKFCCEDITTIENYEQAINDQSQTWHCHHRLEIQDGGTRFSSKELIANKLYYHRPASELVFLTRSEHRRLHQKGKPSPNKGKKREPFSEEWKGKLSEAKKGERNHNFGKQHSEETKRKISEAIKRQWSKRKNSQNGIY